MTWTLCTTNHKISYSTYYMANISTFRTFTYFILFVISVFHEENNAETYG